MNPTCNALLLAISIFWRQSDIHKVRTPEFRRTDALLRSVLTPSIQVYWFSASMTEADMAKRFNDKSFAQVQLTKGDERKFAVWANDGPKNGIQAMNELLGQGYKVSITWVVESNAFCVSLIGTDDTPVNKNSIMTSWSDDLEECFLIAAYKHLEVCGGGEWPTAADGKKWG